VCETCAPKAERYAARRPIVDPAPLSEEELTAAVQVLGELTGVQARDLRMRLVKDEGSAAQRQVWKRAVNDYDARLRARGEAFIDDLVVGARYRVRYWTLTECPSVAAARSTPSRTH
jgi:hypothetical protein